MITPSLKGVSNVTSNFQRIRLLALAASAIGLLLGSQPVRAQQTSSLILAPVYTSAVSSTQGSFLRVSNSSTTNGDVTATIRASGSSTILGSWTSSIPAGTSQQFDIAAIEEATGIDPGVVASYALEITADFSGFAQHVVWNALGGSLTNISSCAAEAEDSGARLINVHTAQLPNYPSQIVVVNTGTAEDVASFDVVSSLTGEVIATNFSQSVPHASSWSFTVADFASSVGFVAEDGEYHIDFVLNDGFTGFAQHLVDNVQGGVITDMTPKCVLPVQQTVSEGTLGTPSLPATPFNYANPDLPAHFTQANGVDFGSIAATDNTPANNLVTDAGATLGRVLFYDVRLSANDTISCASCHIQELGFTDRNQFSVGFEGGVTARHSMALGNARYYERGAFFWDERADTLEDQVLQPIQDPIEMGMNLTDLETKLSATSFYPDLFNDAFGTTAVTSERISFALAQFVRSMVSYQSRFDQAFDNDGDYVPGVLTAQEDLGRQLFFSNGNGPNCDSCHETASMSLDQPRNNGLDANTQADQGSGGGRFKAPSLRNIAVRAHFMHDGRFSTLEQVIEHYNSGIQDHPNLANQLQENGEPEQLNLSEAEKDALEAFLGTLTDETFLSDAKFSDPF